MHDDLNSDLVEMINHLRPDRYDAGSLDWADDAIAYAETRISDAEARRHTARDRVARLEKIATRGANRLLRQIVASGQPPLDWMDTLCMPISVGSERVALRAVTATDLRVFAADERRAAAADFSTRNATCEAAEAIADEMELRGLTRFEEYVVAVG